LDGCPLTNPPAILGLSYGSMKEAHKEIYRMNRTKIITPNLPKFDCHSILKVMLMELMELMASLLYLLIFFDDQQLTLSIHFNRSRSISKTDLL
jgi:hypothetical protein